jgi:hypothetical protein
VNLSQPKPKKSKKVLRLFKRKKQPKANDVADLPPAPWINGHRVFIVDKTIPQGGYLLDNDDDDDVKR